MFSSTQLLIMVAVILVICYLAFSGSSIKESLVNSPENCTGKVGGCYQIHAAKNDWVKARTDK